MVDRGPLVRDDGRPASQPAVKKPARRAGKPTLASVARKRPQRGTAATCRPPAGRKALAVARVSSRPAAAGRAISACRARAAAPQRPIIEPSFLADGSLLASVGPARIPTRLYLGIPNLPTDPIAFTWPVLGQVMSSFGQRGIGWHAGLDITAEPGTPIVAAAPGVVYASGWEGSYGWVVKMDHKGGFSTVYAHNLQNMVEVGDTVEAGAVIALVGRTGRASGPHLHFEIRRDGMAYNPIFLLNARDQQPGPEPGETTAVYPVSETGDEDAGE